MCVRNEQGFDKVFVFGGRRLFAAPAATLSLIVGGRLGFDIAAVGQGNDHFTLRNQVFIGNVAAERVDFAAAFVAIVGFDFFQFVTDDLGNAFGLGEDVHKVDDFTHQVFVAFDNFFLIEASQVSQAHA